MTTPTPLKTHQGSFIAFQMKFTHPRMVHKTLQPLPYTPYSQLLRPCTSQEG